MIRVLVWARSSITRAGLESLVRADARFEICDAHDFPGDTARAVGTLAPDVVLLEAPGQALLGSLLSGPSNGRKLVVMTDALSRNEIRQLLQSGVRALLTREATPEEILAGLAAAAEGLAVISTDFLDLLLPATAEAMHATPVGEPLTAREIEVLSLLAEGAANKEIASRLAISEHTVKFHVSAILGKLGAASRTEAVSRGYREGLIAM